jgi:hypothetical protein
MSNNNIVCPVCGGTIIGDGHTVVRHCEHVDVPMDITPDSDVIFCDMAAAEAKEESSSYIPKDKHEDFDVMAQGNSDFTMKAFPVCGKDGMMLVIDTSEGAAYITKEQAMIFFGLIDPEAVAPLVAAPMAIDEIPSFYELFPYEYQGGGYFRKKGVPVKVSAPTLHGEQAVQYVYDKIKALPR